MSSFNRTFSASPVLVMPSQAAHQTSFGASAFSHQTPSFSNFFAFSSNASLPQSYVSPSNFERRGRKRSRDEASENLDDRVSAVCAADASSQLVEQKAAAKASQRLESASLASKQQEQDRPPLRSHKSQRLDVSTSNMDLNSNRSSPHNNTSNPSNPIPSFSLDSAAAPIVDDFTIAFGIGWRLINADSTISAAVRGWAKYLENHYPVSNVRIHAESKGLQSYLVKANEGWFLFDENLRQGRLVSTDNERCINNLKSSPPVFDGAETMTACLRTALPSHASDMDTDMN